MRNAPSGVRQPLVRRLMPLAWGLALVVGVLLGLSWGALKIQIALAGFLNGESIWSKAQKQSVIDLDAYVMSGRPADLEGFRRQYKILLDFRYARDAVEQPDYDYARVASILRADNAMPEAVPMIIFMMRHLQRAPYMRGSLDAWRSTDARVDQLAVIARRLQDAYAAGHVDDAMVRSERRTVSEINHYIEPRSKRFSTMMASGALWVSHLLFGVLVSAGLLAVFLWLWLARRILADIRGTEESYRLLFDSAADAIVMVEDASGTILQVNRMATIWTGQSEDELVGRPYADLFEQRGRSVTREDHVSMLKGGGGRTRPVEVSSSVALWGDATKVRQEILRDLTERMDIARERRVASEAMASVAEGVVITGAARQVLTVNAAYVRMTGYAPHELEGVPITELRRMPDGQSLPPSMWVDIERDGHWSGEVKARRRDGSVYPEMLSVSAIRGGDGRIEHYVAVCTDITESKNSQRHLQYLASHDALTGLANRSEFERCVTEVIQASGRRNEVAAVMFVDLDNFKLVNDSYSHAIGDRMLTAVAGCIRRCLPPGAAAGRIGGDEFTILVGGLKAREDVQELAEQLLESLSQPFTIEGYELALGASIGIASFPLDGDDATTLLTHADAAMYNAKQEERNSFRFYSPRMRADANRRLLLLTDLRSALDQGQFRLLFQPSMSFANGRVVGAEALVRWEHPERGRIMPDEFVPIAETLGLIRHIDEWVLNSACEQIASWNRSGLDPIRVAVNISASWFSHPDFVQQVTQAIRQHGIEPRQIMLEITESTILTLGDATRRTMAALHALGVAVAIDDFGTGYSSLSYLKLPAVAFLKIDRCFIDELPDSAEDASIVRAMMGLARNLGLAVIAEGVETEAQHDFLRRAGCEEGQGYLYAKPIAAEELEQRVRAQSPARAPHLRLVPPLQ